LGYESFETELTVIPQVDVSNPKMISQGPSICLFNKADSGVVMASWLFAQYLLSDSIQMAYQKTEGYLPVTKSVLNGEEFKNYLNSDEIYSGCKKAKELLLNNLDKTFITPVFNGSADVRSAAGYLINAVSTATNAFQTESAIKDKLYPAAIKNYDLTELYNHTNFDSETEEEKPKEEINSNDMQVWKYVLIIGLISVWVGLIAYFIYSFIKKKKQE
jgi:multiple sugar transport system substrate-binding protein